MNTTTNDIAAPAPASAADRAAARLVLDRAVAGGGVPGILTEIADEGGTWVATAGVADTTTGRERLPHDRFRIGSTTKTFTATVVLQLVAEGRLDLDDPVEALLPDLVRGADRDARGITVRQLLNHTSGLFDYVHDPVIVGRSMGEPFLRHRFDVYRPEELVGLALAHPPHFAPGERFGYSNTNYFLAGMIIERVTGAPLADAFAERIARPLGLTATYLPRAGESVIEGPHGRHYSKLMLPEPDATVHDVTELDPSWGWAAGGAVSTTGDLLRFFTALLAGRLLPPAQQAQMFTTVTTEQWIPDTAYGLGVASVSLPGGVTVWGMGGAINGSWTYTFGSRDGARMVSVNANGDWNFPIAAFTELLQAEFAPEPAPGSAPGSAASPMA
ncbi:serine hydrolase domain-containing protein [Streptomyces sp. NPDC048606]|uniref:serine hydrolase domain-containing protein n=1 Tax=Streptomyces sp. NPDC048606 TaxID=3154726 RepID=UPI00342BD4B2